MGRKIDLTGKPLSVIDNAPTIAPPFVAFGEVLSAAEAARCAGVGEGAIAEAIESGDLPAGEGALGPYVKRADLVDLVRRR